MPEWLVDSSDFLTQVQMRYIINWFEFNVENNSRLARAANNEHRKFSLKCIICNLSSYSKLKPFYKLLVRFCGRDRPPRKSKFKDNLEPLASRHVRTRHAL